MGVYLTILIVGLKLIIGSATENTAENYCMVREAKFSYNFDFSELTNKDEDYVIRHKEYDFLKFQLCKPLKDKCNGFNDIAVCHYDENKQIAIGKEPPKVAVEFGETIFKYTGENCKINRNYTVNIKMICDFTATQANDIKWFPNSDEDCAFNLEWRTVNACPERQQIECSINHESGRYDLSPLINYSDNYEVRISNKYLIVLNVCHTVLYRTNSCHSNNAACLVSSENQDDSQNLGIPTEDLKYNSVDKSLSLTYTDGAICTARNVKVNHIQTTVTFFCDLNATETLPQYVGGMENCHYQLKWVTAAACSEEALKKKSSKKPIDQICTVQNPLNNYMFNLSSLISREFSTSRFDMKEYYNFSICSRLPNTGCAAGTGVCQIKGNISRGLANSNLMWKESGPYLNYTNGNSCGQRSQRSYTIIEFYCDEDEDYVIEETDDPCYNKIKMSTNLACAKSIKSCVTHNNEVNLDSLKHELSNYAIKSKNSEYRLNVCKSLVNEEGLNCPTGTAICKFTYERGRLTNPISLGYPSENLIRTTDRSAVLIYRNGSSCKENKNKTIESSISFLCDIRNRQGMPNLTFYKDCTYFFDWRTELVCGIVNGKLHEQNCLISNSLGDVRDLSFLQEFLGPQYAIHNRIYNFSLCGHRYCKNGVICTEEINYGTIVNVLFDYSGNLIRIHFTQGDKCEDGSKAKSSITLICKEGDLASQPSVIKEEPCNIEFEWYTSKICQKQNYMPEESSKQPIVSEKNHTNINIIGNKTKIIQNGSGNKEESKLPESNSLTGGQIVGIIIVIAFIVASLIYAAKRWNVFYKGFEVFD